MVDDVTGPTRIFQGYNSITGSGCSSAVTGIKQSVGGESTVFVEVCRDIDSVRRTLDIDLSVTIDTTPGGGNEKYEFFDSLEITTNTITIILRAKHIQEEEVYQQVEFLPGKQPGPEDHGQSVDDFVNAHGDAFVSSITWGGEFIAAYVFYSKDLVERTEFDNKLQAHGITSGVTVDAELQTKLTTFVKDNQTLMRFKQNIWGIKNPSPPMAENLVAYGIGFISIPIDQPVVISFKSIGYESVNSARAFRRVMQNRELFLGSPGIEGLLTRLRKLDALRQQITRIEEVFQFYTQGSDPSIQDAANRVDTDLRAIYDLVKTYEASPTAVLKPPSEQIRSDYSLALKYDVGFSTDQKATEFDPFIDIDIRLAVMNLTRPTSVQLRGDGVLVGLTGLYVTYETLNGAFLKMHGGNWGSTLTRKLEFLPGEFVTKMSGLLSPGPRHFMRYCVITKSNNDSIENGVNHGLPFIPFFWDCPPDCFVIGFQGRADATPDNSFVADIQAIYIRLLPPQWESLPSSS